MLDRPATFKYRLAPLLRKEQWEQRILATELKRASQVVQEKQRVHEAALQAIAATQAQLRELYCPNASISISRKEVLELFLKDRQEYANTCERELIQAQRIYADVLANLQTKQRQIKMLERHRDRQERLQAQQQTRLGLKAADELWLVGYRSR